MTITYDATAGPPNSAQLLHDLGYFGHYLHVHAGGRGGQQFVLTTLSMSDAGLTQRELLERCKTSSASLSEVLSKLEAEGLVTRTACAKDRRQLHIQLTEEGERRAAHMRQKRERFEREAFACLSPQDRTTLASLLARTKRHWMTLEESEVSA